jgi:serine O-acetyltransferase
MPIADLNLTEILLVWAATGILLIMLWLGSCAAIYGVIRLKPQARLAADFSRKVSKKKQLRSGRHAKLSFLFVAGLLTLDNGIQASTLYRISHFLANRRMRVPAELVHAFAKFATSIDISPYADVGGGLYLNHGLGVVIGKFTSIGDDVTVSQGVTTGSGRPQIGDGAELWAGAKVIGDVSIGDSAVVGANAVVLEDVPAGALAVGVPARVR